MQVIQRGRGPWQNNTDVVYVIAGDMQVIQRGGGSWSNNIDVVYVNMAV